MANHHFSHGRWAVCVLSIVSVFHAAALPLDADRLSDETHLKEVYSSRPAFLQRRTGEPAPASFEAAATEEAKPAASTPAAAAKKPAAAAKKPAAAAKKPAAAAKKPAAAANKTAAAAKKPAAAAKKPAAAAKKPAAAAKKPAAAAAPAAATSNPAEIVDGTITQLYWQKVDSALAAARMVTPKPKSLNDLPPPPKPQPWDKILDAKDVVEVLDTPAAAQSLDNYNLATPPPPIPQLSKMKSNFRKMSVLPYQMTLGAEIMASITAKNTPSPLPPQVFVDQTMVAQCPMMMFANHVLVSGPRCGSNMGQWQDPTTKRSILRWAPNSNGGLKFAVDSAITGPGSVTFAELNQRLTMDSIEFDLYNCLGVRRYSVEEKIIKIDHMSLAGQSTATDHDVSQTQVAVFYQYIIKGADGAPVAQSNLFRLQHNQVNFTAYVNGAPSGPVIGVAKRTGQWTGAQWRKCGANPQGWKIEFSAKKAKELVSVATVADLQVAAAVTLTLAGFREEVVASDGIQHAGETSLYLTVIKSVLTVLFSLILLGVIIAVFYYRRWDKKFLRFCFKLEGVLLPMRPHLKREAPLKPTW
eukprot:TRINITY_DN1933_c0_g2_i2.p1 TRINITY_DN1933_c0_g2~~TRINITY_DN1933_c0_g2_i2.p1  ORF type:complete len:583 (-),score=167.12 TRINITY_DN1933_c0_g2_i2:134-1882(-)